MKIIDVVNLSPEEKYYLIATQNPATIHDYTNGKYTFVLHTVLNGIEIDTHHFIFADTEQDAIKFLDEQLMDIIGGDFGDGIPVLLDNEFREAITSSKITSKCIAKIKMSKKDFINYLKEKDE